MEFSRDMMSFESTRQALVSLQRRLFCCQWLVFFHALQSILITQQDNNVLDRTRSTLQELSDEWSIRKSFNSMYQNAKVKLCKSI